MESINYSWDDIEELKTTKEGIEILMASETAAEAPSKGYPAPLPKPISTDSIGLVLDESSFNFDEATGHLIVPDVTIAKEIVQDYDGVKTWKPKDEIEAMVKFLDHLPIVRGEHPKSGIVSSPSEVGGFLMNPRFIDGSAVADLSITSPDIIADVKSKKTREVSIGFQSSIDVETGKFGDEEYTKVQREIMPNHLAIVKHGRCSLWDGCGITGDKAKEGKTKEKKETPEKNGDSEAEKEILKDAKEIVEAKRKQLIEDIQKISDARTAEELEKTEMKKLEQDLKFFKDAKAKAKGTASLKVSDQEDSDIRKKIDAAYGM